MNVRMRRKLGVAILGMISSTLLIAQNVSYGLNIQGAFPLSDFKDSLDKKVGWGLGAFALFDMWDGHAFKPRVDALTFANPDFQKNALGSGNGLKVRIYSLGVDYNYFFGQKTGEGGYLILGGGLDNAKTTWDSPTGNVQDTKNGISYGAGLGIIAAPHVGFEAKYVRGKFAAYNSAGIPSNSNANRMVFGFVFVY